MLRRTWKYVWPPFTLRELAVLAPVLTVVVIMLEFWHLHFAAVVVLAAALDGSYDWRYRGRNLTGCNGGNDQ